LKKTLVISLILVLVLGGSSVCTWAILDSTVAAQDSTLSIDPAMRSAIQCEIKDPDIHLIMNCSMSPNQVHYKGDVLYLIAYLTPMQSNMTITFYRGQEVIGEAVTGEFGSASIYYRIMETGNFTFYALP
jgi:hypothetical protein